MVDSQTIIDVLFEENRELTEYLAAEKQISFQTHADEKFRKVLILSAASFFEKQVVESIEGAAIQAAPGAAYLVEFIKKKALSRQYHSLFDWDVPNANKFFSLFGDEFKVSMKARIKQEPELDDSIRAFLELGALRNKLVHLNFAAFPLDKTAEEIYALFKRARLFVERLPEYFETAMTNANSEPTSE